MYIADIGMEGNMSQNFDLGLSFFVCYVEEGILKKNDKT